MAVAACATPVRTGIPSAAAGPEILWDSYGVPHIFAADRASLAYAFGWAQMRNHSDLLLRLYQQGRGRAAELLGKDYLEGDRWVWTLDLPRLAQRDYAMQSPGARAHIDAYVAGINAFAAANPGMISDSVRAVLPVTSVDVMTHSLRTFYAVFVSSRQKVRGDTRAWAEKGSNAWAIAPKRSASGHSMLLQNPHLPWGDVFTWMEAQYSAPGVNLSGASLVGSPVLEIAFNDNVGWTHTVNTQDGEDLFELKLADGGYMFDGAVRRFATDMHVLRIRQADGTLRDDTLRVMCSVHGPVVSQKPGKAVALRIVGLAVPLPYAYEQWWNMGRAKNLAEFRAAIEPNQISGQNITYADRDGHIMVFYGGNTPVHSRGDRSYWDGIVPGDSSSTLWTTLHRASDMPFTLDPPSGWVQNANDPPWWATFPVVNDPSRFPAYLAPREMRLRPQRSAQLLESDSSMTYEQFVSNAHSSHMLMADRLLPKLLPAAEASGKPAAVRGGVILRAWDRNADASSRGAVLFNRWWRELGRRTPAGRTPWAEQWSEARPRTTPAGLADPALAVEALETVTARLDSVYGKADVAWGDVYRLQRDGTDLPANGAQEEFGVFMALGYEPVAANRFRASGGTSWVSAIEFGSPIRARSRISYGNSSRAGSPHRADQLQFLARKELKPVWRTRQEVMAHLERREKF